MIRRITMLLALSALAVCGALVAQLPGGDLEMTKSTVDAGGGRCAGGGFELVGTIAQHDAGRRVASGGPFLFAGGFWARAFDVVFRDGFERD